MWFKTHIQHAVSLPLQAKQRQGGSPLSTAIPRKRSPKNLIEHQLQGLHPNEPQRFQSRARGWKSVSEMFFLVGFQSEASTCPLSRKSFKRPGQATMVLSTQHLLRASDGNSLGNPQHEDHLRQIYIYIYIYTYHIYIYILFINTVECTEYCNHIINSTLPNMNGKMLRQLLTTLSVTCHLITFGCSAIPKGCRSSMSVSTSNSKALA